MIPELLETGPDKGAEMRKTATQFAAMALGAGIMLAYVVASLSVALLSLLLMSATVSRGRKPTSLVVGRRSSLDSQYRSRPARPL